MNDTKWFTIDREGYQQNTLYNSQENAWLQHIYMTVKGRVPKQDFKEQEREDRETVRSKLAQGMQQHRVFSQVMSSEYCVINHLRVWEGTHHS